MALRIVAFVAIVCLSGSQGATTRLRATLQASELARLQMLIANTTKALKESQAASAAEKAQSTEKKAMLIANTTKALKESQNASAVEKKAQSTGKKATLIANTTMVLKNSQAASAVEKKAQSTEKKAMLIANTTKVLKESQNASAVEKKIQSIQKKGMLIVNTTKSLKESQAAPATEKKAQAIEKEAEALAVEKKAPAAEKHAPETEKKALVAKHAFAQHVTKERQALIIKQLSAEEEMLDKNLKAIKTEQKLDNSKEKIEGEKHLQSMMKGKDADMLKHFDDFTKHANAKAAVGAQDVLSKLKHMIHFIKKGALAGDDKAANGLDGLLKDMSGMIR